MLPNTDEFEITTTALDALRGGDNASSIRLIDCREADEFAICHIEGAELHPLSSFVDSLPSLVDPDDERSLVVYCHHGMRSMNATFYLREKGLKNVWSLAGGIDLWSLTINPSLPRY